MEKQLLYYILYEALIQIREATYDSNNKKIFWLSNLLHNLPLRLERAVAEDDYKTILLELKRHFKSVGMEKWLDQLEERFKENIKLNNEIKKLRSSGSSE